MENNDRISSIKKFEHNEEILREIRNGIMTQVLEISFGLLVNFKFS